MLCWQVGCQAPEMAKKRSMHTFLVVRDVLYSTGVSMRDYLMID
jgi:hypothetical protein